jgi:hypothetical protein
MVNNAGGILYRWDLATNTLAEKIRLNLPSGGARLLADSQHRGGGATPKTTLEQFADHVLSY